jgi:hypothetical protein
MSERGNFEHGTSVLHEARPAADADTANRLAEARARLLAARALRVRPHRDDKIITAWNGLMIAAFAHGARTLGEPAYAERAERAAEFVWTRLRAADGSLLRRWRDGEAAFAGQLDDHAYFARACRELYAATHEPFWLERAEMVTETMLARFWDDAEGGLFESPSDADGVRVRLKDGFDGAELAGNSIAADNLWRLGMLLERVDWCERAQRSFTFHAGRLAAAPWAMPRMIAAMERGAVAPRHVVIAGDLERDDTRALIAVYESRLRPDEDLVVVEESSRGRLAKLVPFAAELPMRDARATAYVCLDYACRQPVHEPQELAALLEG